MKYNKKLIPFIKEWTLFLLCNNICAILIISLPLKFNIQSLKTFCLVLGIFSLILTAFFRIGNLGFRAFLDIIFQKTKKEEFVFLKIQRYNASGFTEKYGHRWNKSGVKRIAYTHKYYLIYMKKNDSIYTFISPFYIELVKGNSYLLTTAQFSNIVFESSCINKQ